MIKDNDMEPVVSSGNIFRDLGFADAGILELKADLAARIIGVLDDRELTVRRAEELTGIAAADFSRIRNAKLDRFTVDRLLTALLRLDARFSVRVSHRARPSRTSPRKAA